MESNYLSAKSKLEKYGQEHLLEYYNELNECKKEQLIDDVLSTDFEQMKNLYENINNKKEDNAKIEQIKYINKEELTKEEKNYYDEIGIKSIKNGEYAVVTMAGGQRNKAWTYWSKRYL